MYAYEWDPETGGLLLLPKPADFSKEPRPVYYQELDILGFDKYWNYAKDDSFPYMWAEANNYFYHGRKVAQTKGGSFCHAPEIQLIEDPESDGKPLQFVDVPRMVEKNHVILDSLVQETVKQVYNTYKKYQNKVDVFYVAFSGGKDSVVTLDIVQKALPHNAFKVLFGDTQMEFSDTYDVVNQIEKWCNTNGIQFLKAKSDFTPEFTWKTIGPPAQRMRWCCSIHKTAPQINLLRKITNNPHFRGMAMMGVRADESVSRSKYEDLNYGTKHKGQFDFYPILSWNSGELFLYIYQENLIINETYKKGNSRAGCIVCPMEADKNTWFKNQLYANTVENQNSTTFFNKIIIEKTIAHDQSEIEQQNFLDFGVWRSRHNGTKLYKPQDLYHEERIGNNYFIRLSKISTDWKQWIKTIGEVTYISDNSFTIDYDKNKYLITHENVENGKQFVVRDILNTQIDIYFLSWLKMALKKAAYCITCHVCEVNCPHGFIAMSEGQVVIDDKCIKCKECYKVEGGCLVANSHHLPKEGKKMNGSIDQYKNMGIQYSWVEDFLIKKDDFWENNNLGSQMITSLSLFLRQAGLCEKKRITPFGEMISNLGADSQIAWGLILSNLVYTPQFNWWAKTIDFNQIYYYEKLDDQLKEYSLTDNSRKNIISSIKNIFYSNPVLSDQIGFGKVTVETKGRNTYLLEASRTPWLTPDPRVILYSLYKFADACDGYYQFSLTRLLDHEIESEGVSPTQIFGLDRATMEEILKGLSVNYPEFISTAFNLGLDTINLNREKTSSDVLSLF